MQRGIYFDGWHRGHRYYPPSVSGIQEAARGAARHRHRSVLPAVNGHAVIEGRRA